MGVGRAGVASRDWVTVCYMLGSHNSPTDQPPAPQIALQACSHMPRERTDSNPVPHRSDTSPPHPTTHTDHQPNTISLTTQLNGEPSHSGYSTLWPSPTAPHTRPTHPQHTQPKPSTSDHTDTPTVTYTSHNNITGHPHNSPTDHPTAPQIAL